MAIVLESTISAMGMWLFIAGLTEAITEILKNLFPEAIKDKATYLTSIVVGISLALAFRLNPFGLTEGAAYASMIAAGILGSRGANYLNIMFKNLGLLPANNNRMK